MLIYLSHYYSWVGDIIIMEGENKLGMDLQKIGENKKIMKQLDQSQIIIMSAKIIKINHVNKRQQRVLVITNKHLLNIASPSSFLPNRIKRKIPLLKVTGVTLSRYGNQIVFHIEQQDDYRFFTHNLRNKFVQNFVTTFSALTNKTVKLYVYDDLALSQYTTTIVDIQQKKRKLPKCQPVFVDAQSVMRRDFDKTESKLVFRSKGSLNAEAFEQFQIIKVLGRGAYGKVMLVKHRNSGGYFAVKSMRKQNLVEKESLERTKTQRKLLEIVDHPFLVNLQYAFQTKEKIFLVMKFYRGGQMFSQIRRQQRFTEERARFYAAQVTLALAYLHSLGYVYRDLKPQNILFDTNGYIRVSDYGLARRLGTGERAFSLTGTPSYLSPEVLLKEGHTFTVDWWALGVLIYEMLFSSPPFYNKDQTTMFKQIINKELEFPKNISSTPECRSLLRGLLNKYPQKRLGNRSSEDVKLHPWFKDIDWQKLQKMEIPAPYIPELHSQQDVSKFHQSFTSQQPVDTLVECDQAVLQKFQKQFGNFQFHRQMSQQQQSRKSKEPFSPSPNFKKK